MAFALLILTFGSIFLGIFGRDLFVGPGTEFWNGTVASNAALATGQVAGEFLPTYVKLIPLFSAIIATAAVFYVYGRLVLERTPYAEFAQYLGLYRFFSHKWGFDTVYNHFINRPLLDGAYNITFSLIDKGLLELAGPTGLSKQAITTGRVLASFQTGRVYDYAGFMLVALCVATLLSSFL